MLASEKKKPAPNCFRAGEKLLSQLRELIHHIDGRVLSGVRSIEPPHWRFPSM